MEPPDGSQRAGANLQLAAAKFLQAETIPGPVPRPKSFTETGNGAQDLAPVTDFEPGVGCRSCEQIEGRSEPARGPANAKPENCRTERNQNQKRAQDEGVPVHPQWPGSEIVVGEPPPRAQGRQQHQQACCVA